MKTIRTMIVYFLSFLMMIPTIPVKADESASIGYEGNGRFYIKVGESAGIPVILNGFDEDNSISWTIDDGDCIEMDENGTVHALTEGDAAVTATLDNGNTCTVHIIVYADTDHIEITDRQFTIDLDAEEKTELHISSISADTSERLFDNVEFTYEIENPNVFAVTAEQWGTYIEPLSTGTSRFRAVSPNGVCSEWMKVNVIDSSMSEQEEAVSEEILFEEETESEEIIFEPEEEEEVIEAVNDTIHVTEVILNHENFDMYEGRKLQLDVMVLPKNASNKNVIWRSSNENIAVVDQAGIVTAKTQGTVTITAESEDGSISASCSINVGPNYGDGAMISPVGNGRFYIMRGTTGQIPVNLENYSDGQNTITYSLDYANDNCIRLDSDGTVYADNYGNASVTARLDNGYTCSIQVIVYSDDFESIRMDHDSYTLNLSSGERYFTVMAEYPGKVVRRSDNAIFTYEIEDPTIVSVHEETWGTYISPLQTGSTRICITAQNGVSTGWFNVAVVDGDYADSISPKNGTDSTYVVDIGDSVYPEYELWPVGGTFADEQVKWSLERETGTVEVDADTGKITGLKYGSASVIAEITNGDRTYFNIIVQPKLTSLKFDETKKYTITTDERQIYLGNYIIREPSDAYSRVLICTSSNPDVMAVSDHDSTNVYIKKTGTAILTVASKDDPSLQTSHEFTIVNSVNATGMKAVSDAELTCYMNHSGVYNLQVEYEPIAAKTTTSWSSSDPDVVSVSPSNTASNWLTLKKPGTAVVTAQSQSNSNLSVQFTVHVTDEEPPVGIYKTDVNFRKYVSDSQLSDGDILSQNPEKFVMVEGQKRVIEVNYEGTYIIPDIPTIMDRLDQLTIVDTAASGGATGADTKVRGGVSSVLTAVKPGTEVLKLGNDYSVELTVLGFDAEMTDPKVTAEDHIDESLVQDLMMSEDMGLKNHLAEAVTSVEELETIDTEGVKEIRAETYLDINALESTVDETDKTINIKLDITPKYQIVKEMDDGTSEATDPKELTISKPVAMVIPLGHLFDNLEDINKVYIIHEHNGKQYQYEGDLYGGVVTFMNQHGFSTFTIMDKDQSVAHIGDAGFLYLQEAADALKNNDVLTVTDMVEDGAVALINRPLTFRLDKQTEKNITIQTGHDYELSIDGDTYTIKRKPVKAESVSLDETAKIISSTEQVTLKAAVMPTNADNKNVTWSSGNENVLTVDQDGNITVNRSGKATVTVTTEDGGHTADCDITVLFNDVNNPSQYYYNAVYWAVDNAITQGNGPFTFNPTGFCKRYQFVLFLWRQAGSPEPAMKEDPFTDVTSDPNKDAYEKAVLWAAEKGYTTGTTPTTFDPYAPLTRGQVVTFLYRVAGEPPVAATVNPFKDVQAGKYYYTPVLWAVEKEITTGVKPGEFQPTVTCNRGQTVVFMQRQFK